MSSDLVKKCVFLEGLPEPSSGVDISTLVTALLGIEPLRIQSAQQLTTSNTPTWILLCNTEEEASTLSTVKDQYEEYGVTFPITGKPCTIGDIPEEWKRSSFDQEDPVISDDDNDDVDDVNDDQEGSGDDPGGVMLDYDSLHFTSQGLEEEMEDMASYLTPVKQSSSTLDHEQTDEKHPQNSEQTRDTPLFQEEHKQTSSQRPSLQEHGPVYRATSYLHPLPDFSSEPDHDVRPPLPKRDPPEELMNPQSYPKIPSFSRSSSSSQVSYHHYESLLPEPTTVLSNTHHSDSGSPPPLPKRRHPIASRNPQPHPKVPSPSQTQHSESVEDWKNAVCAEREVKPQSHVMETIIEVHGSDVSSSGKDIYVFFFENSRRGGGEIENFEVTEDNVLLITFKDPLVAQQLIKKGKVNVGPNEVTIKRHIPLPIDQYKVLLGYPGAHLDLNSEDLRNYIEARSKGEKITGTEAGSKQDLLLVTFEHPIDIHKLQSACRERFFRENLVNVWKVTATNIVQVQGIPKNTYSDTVQDYFETHKVTGHTDLEVTKVDVIEEIDTYLVHFRDFHAVGPIIQVQHLLGSQPLQVRLFHKCIGTIMSGQTTRAPKEKVVENVHPLIVKLLIKSKTLMLKLNKKAKGYDMSLSINKNGNLCVTAEAALDSDVKFEENMLQVATDILDENIAQYSLHVSKDMKDEIKSAIAELKYDPEAVGFYMTTDSLVIVGSTIEAAVMKEKLERFLHPTVKTDELKPLAACLLSAMDFEEDMRKEYPGVNVKIDTQTNKVHITGPEHKANDAQVQMFKVVSSTETVELQNISKQRLSLLQKTVVKEEIKSRQGRSGITAAWRTTHSSIEVISKSKSDAEAAGKLISETVIERAFSVGQLSHILDTKSWKSLQAELTATFPERLIITIAQNESLLIAGTNDAVDDVFDTVSTFFTANVDEKTIVGVPRGIFRFIKIHLDNEVEQIAQDSKDSHVQISYGENFPVFIVNGLPKGMKYSKEKLGLLASKIIHAREPSLKAGMAKLLTTPEKDRLINDIEQNERCVVEIETRTNTGHLHVSTASSTAHSNQLKEQQQLAWSAHKTTAQKATIQQASREVVLVKGVIAKQRVDVIVNSTNQQLKLNEAGAVSKSLLEAAGPELQSVCARDYPAGIPSGSVAVTKGGKLQCKWVYHIFLPGYSTDQDAIKDVKDLVIGCLTRACHSKASSIAFPALGTGGLKYPADVVAECMIQTIHNYWAHNPGSSLTDVSIVLYDKDQPTIMAFEKKKGRSGPSTRYSQHQVSHHQAVQQSGPYVNLVKGELAQQKADVIVNSTNQQLELKEAGAVSKSLFEVAGSELQSACARRYPSGIPSGDVAITRGGKLQCNRVYHIFLPEYTTDQEAHKDVCDLVMKCLTAASRHTTSSIAFPAFGTGGLGYPHQLVAECMLKSIHEFWKKNPGSQLKDVRIVLYHKNQPAIMAFENENANYGQKVGYVKRQPSHLSPMNYSGSDVALVKGEIAKQQVDVFVNSTNQKLDWDKVGAVSKSLLRAAGPELQSACANDYPGGIPSGSVAITIGGKLRCKRVYHIYLPVYTNNQQAILDLKDLVLKCLMKAGSYGSSSIAFPALGTGGLRYPRELVAECMIKTVHEYWTQNPGSSLKDVRIVLYHKDHPTIAAFEQEMNSRTSNIPKRERHLKSAKHTEEPMDDDNCGVAFDNIQFNMLHGDLLEEQVDCIVADVTSDFDLTQGVTNQAILKKFGVPVPATSTHKGSAKDLKSKGCTLTEVSNAPFTKVIHFEGACFDNKLKKILKACVKEADKAGCSSIAFPALAPGPGGGTPNTFFENLYETLDGLSKQKCVNEVRLVVSDQSLYGQYTSLLTRLLTNKGIKGTSLLRKLGLKKSTKPKLGRSSALLSARSRSKRVPQNDPEITVEVSFFSDTQSDIQKAKQRLDDAHKKECAQLNVDNEALKILGNDKIDSLKREAKQRDVYIEVNKQLGRIQVQGMKDDATAIQQRIYELCLEKKEDEKAEVMGSVVQWYYMEMMQEEEKTEYDQETNKAIEKAFRENKDTLVLEDTDGVRYVVDFRDMVEYREDDSERCPIVRKDLIEAADFDFPSYWEKLKTTENLKEVTVPPRSAEYIRVSDQFASSNKQIIQIKRIQNKTLYKQYQAKKQLFTTQKASKSHHCERELWHGTATEAIPSINKDGFNRSYCGKNAAAYGDGVYFAVDVNYSANDTYSRPDAMGNKYMYLVDVLTGEFAKGKSGMRVPPPVDPAVPSVLYDSVVNDTRSPAMFVIFNDTQAYPKYLITFR